MIRYIFALLLVVRNFFQGVASRLLNRFRDPKTGKFAQITPRTLSYILWTTAIVFFFLVITTRLMNNKVRLSGGAEQFQKEMTPKLGGNFFPPEFEIKEDKLNEEIDRVLGDEAKDVFNKDANIKEDFVGLGVDPSVEGGPSKAQCELVFEKMKAGDSLSSTDKAEMEKCLENNTLELTPDQIEFAKALMKDDLTQEERELLQKALSGEATEEELKLAKGLASSDKSVRDSARAAIADPSKREAFFKSLDEKKEKELKEKGELINPGELASLAEKVKKESDELSTLKESLAAAQAAAAKVGEKLAKGLSLSDKEQDLLSSVSDIQKEIKKKKASIEQTKSVLDEKSRKLQSTLSEIESKLDEPLPSDFGVAFEEDSAKVLDGESISPEKMRLWAIKRKNSIELQIKNRDKSDSESGKPDSEKSGDSKELTKEDCESLIEKFNLKKELTSSEKEKLSVCVEKNIAGLTKEQLEELRNSINDPTVLSKEDLVKIADSLIEDRVLSKEELELLAKALSGKATKDEIPLVKAIISEDPTLRDWTKKAIKDPELKSAFSNQLQEKTLSKKEKDLLEEAFGAGFSDVIKLGDDLKLAQKGESPKGSENSQINFREEFKKSKGISGGQEKDSLVRGYEALNPKDVAAQSGAGAQTDLSQLVVFSDKSLKPFSLSPDMKIPAVLATSILISDKGKPQIVRVKTLADVFEPESNKLVIPKGSIVVGTTAGFDAETGIMDLSFDKVSIGGGKVIAASFSVGSADGSFGLKGEVRDTRGKLLLGTFISSFSAGALNWFSQSIIQPFLQSTTPTDALLGAGMGGASEVAQKIADMYAGDLTNSARIFYAPKIPIILYPQ